MRNNSRSPNSRPLRSAELGEGYFLRFANAELQHDETWVDLQGSLNKIFKVLDAQV